MSPWEKIGIIGVDAGLCWIGDPCYILHRGDEAPADIGKDWDDFCKLLDLKEKVQGKRQAQFNFDMGHPGLGVVVSTGWGDGTYDVYVRRAEGRVKAVMVVFDDDAAKAEGV